MIFKVRISKGISVKDKSVQVIISSKLTKEFEPDLLSIVDESKKHVGHNPEAAKGGTHFRVKIVSKKFQGMSKVERHRWVYTVLTDEMKEGVHALALTTYDPDENPAG